MSIHYFKILLLYFIIKSQIFINYEHKSGWVADNTPFGDHCTNTCTLIHVQYTHTYTVWNVECLLEMLTIVPFRFDFCLSWKLSLYYFLIGLYLHKDPFMHFYFTLIYKFACISDHLVPWCHHTYRYRYFSYQIPFPYLCYIATILRYIIIYCSQSRKLDKLIWSSLIWSSKNYIIIVVKVNVININTLAISSTLCIHVNE